MLLKQHGSLQIVIFNPYSRRTVKIYKAWLLGRNEFSSESLYLEEITSVITN